MERRSPSTRIPRPAWMLWIIAMPVAVLINGLTGGVENLSGSLLVLVGWDHEPTILQRWLAKTMAHVVLPCLLSFAVLKVTRLGLAGPESPGFGRVVAGRWAIARDRGMGLVPGRDRWHPLPAQTLQHACWRHVDPERGHRPVITCRLDGLAPHAAR